MATTLQQIKLGKSHIWVEIEQKSVGGPKTTKTSASAAKSAINTLSQADISSTLNSVFAPVHQALQAMAPQEVQVELSLGIRGEVGVFVAKGEGNASLKVTARWKFESHPTAKD